MNRRDGSRHPSQAVHGVALDTQEDGRATREHFRHGRRDAWLDAIFREDGLSRGDGAQAAPRSLGSKYATSPVEHSELELVRPLARQTQGGLAV